jgi:hypothetical protein
MKVLNRAALLIVTVSWAGLGVAQGAPLVLPSGIEAQFHDSIWDEDLSAIRLRYVVPYLSEPESIYQADALRVFDDMQWLCETQITNFFDNWLAVQEEGWEVVVVTLMDKPIEFGARDAETIQLFEWFAVTMDGCEPEMEVYHE